MLYSTELWEPIHLNTEFACIPEKNRTGIFSFCLTNSPAFCKISDFPNKYKSRVVIVSDKRNQMELGKPGVRSLILPFEPSKINSVAGSGCKTQPLPYGKLRILRGINDWD